MASPIPKLEDMIKEGIQLYLDKFHDLPSVAASAPGRVNLIGEHTDYNNGFVLPVALPMVTVVVGKMTNSRGINIFTDANVSSEKFVIFSTPNISALTPGEPKWANYIKGVIQLFKGNVPGFNAVIVSSVPMGGGLSSSAALEVAMYTFLESLTGQKTVNLKDKAQLCQKAEHEFAKVPCGIMDQYISILGQPGRALFLDCEKLLYEQVPFARADIIILVTNTNVPHYLNSSDEYAERKKQCEEAAKILGVKSLRDATMTMLQVRQNELDELTFRRARHVITEIERTAEAANALRNEDYYTFGKQMNQSHKSLRDDYNVSCSELDQLVEIAWKSEGVFGARMTGAGFGGCTVTLMRSSFVEELIGRIQKEYNKTATFHIVHASGGAQDDTPILHKLLF